MATTFKALVCADGRRRDGTYNVKIRITHNRRSLKVATHLYAGPEDLTRGLRIKNQDYLDQTGALIRRWRGIVAQLGAAAGAMDVKQIRAHVREAERGDQVFHLDFVAYGREVASRKAEGTGRVYTTALNCLERYAHGRAIDVSAITVRFLENFEAFIRSEPVPGSGRSKESGRAVSLYLACLRHVHNEARREFNDEDSSVMRIPRAPFAKYAVAKPPRARKRAVTREIIQSMIDLPDQLRVDGPPDSFTRRDLARDCFLLSFALAGMNAADLYDCPAQRLDPGAPVIGYKRKKTRARRDDEAEMRMRVEPCVAGLADKYADPTGERLFCFYRHYSSPEAFNTALRLGLLQVERAIGAPEHFTFYAARHSYATISRSNVLNVDKYTVHEGLNHVDPSMRVTDGYIARDFGNVWAANARLLALFDWSSLEWREAMR